MSNPPVCRRVNPADQSSPLPCRFWTNEKGGVTGDLGVRYVRGCIEPAMPGLSPENPGLLIMDGHGSHFTLELLLYCRQIGLHILLRPPHTTHILQGEDVVHFGIFKPEYHRAKVTALAKKVLAGTYKLSVQDLLQVAKAPWEKAFNMHNGLKAWDAIGVSPFTMRVYWDLLAAQKERAEVAVSVSIDPELLTVKGMVKVIFGDKDAPAGEDGPAGEDAPADEDAPANGAMRPKRRRDRDTLNSSSLWDCPGGATGDECIAMVQRKTDAREAKAQASKSRKADRAARLQQANAAGNELGSRIAGALVHAHQLKKLSRPQVEALLRFKGIEWPKTALKSALLALAEDAVKLPSDGTSPALVIPDAPAAAPAAAASSAADDEHASSSSEDDEDEEENIPNN